MQRQDTTGLSSPGQLDNKADQAQAKLSKVIEKGHTVHYGAEQANSLARQVRAGQRQGKARKGQR